MQTGRSISRRAMLGGALGAPAFLRARARRPNVLFIFSDDQQADTIASLGNPHVRTPHLDSLVQRGVSFNRAYNMGGAAPAVCVASRAMLFTGQTLFRADERLTADVTGRGRKGPFSLLHQHFLSHGYRTFGTGKWHNRAPIFARGFSSGANILIGGGSDHYKVPLHDFRPDRDYPAQPDRIGTSHSSELFSDAAIRYIQEDHGADPFFLYLAYTAPHDPHMSPTSFRKAYPPGRMRVPANFLPEHPFDNGELKIRDEMLAPFPRTRRIIQQYLSDYYAMISHMDAQIGRVLRALEAAGEADGTIVVFSSDNGLAAGQHGLLGKQNLYEHSVRVPLVLCGPGIPRGRRSDALCYLFDLFPTLCELCSVPPADHVEGRSVAPAMVDQNAAVRNSLFFAYRDFQRAVTEGDWKMIRYRTGSPVRLQLFNLHEDPLERNNLAATSAGAERVAAMDRTLQEWMTTTGDPMQSAEQFRSGV
jgi:arylsulfatase A-like enzyme